MNDGETLICPYCGREQYTHEPDDIPPHSVCCCIPV